MAEWLKRDPANGMLLGPDGCHYANEYQAAHYGLLQLCGCGQPEAAYNFCRGVLALFDRRKFLEKPYGERDDAAWIDAEAALEKLLQECPKQAAHVFAHLFTHLNLLEHGGSVGGSWLTKDGERIVDLGPITDQLEAE